MSESFSSIILGKAKNHLLEGEKPREQNLAAVIHVLQQILKASATARKEGLLALEEYANESRAGGTFADLFLADTLLFIVDGTEPELLKKILTNRILVQGPDTLEGYLCYIILEGSLYIQAGENPRLIEEIMYSYIPASLKGRISKVIRQEQEELSETYKQRMVEKWNAYQPAATDNPFIGLFEEKMKFYSDREIQRILREVEFKELGTVLAYCSQEVKNRISDNLTDNVKANLMDSMWYVTESDLTPALNCMLRAINKLADYGEIRDKDA
ncbi:MAG: hypothetical protein J6A77_13750 [Lachnospiraceae bacterium]|nr:hypothetical protein [Lachnospiraceae bacterium]